MLKHITQVFFFCVAPEGSAEWYERLFGLERDAGETVPGQFVLIRIEEIELGFHLADLKSPVSTGGCVVYWGVPNLQSTISLAESMGGKLYRGPIQVHSLPRWMAQIKDPFGNVIGIESQQRF